MDMTLAYEANRMDAMDSLQLNGITAAATRRIVSTPCPRPKFRHVKRDSTGEMSCWMSRR